MQEEQDAIMKSKKGGGLDWGDTKKMSVTTRVIQETMRVASILSFTFREAVEDVEFQGKLIVVPRVSSSIIITIKIKTLNSIDVRKNFNRISHSKRMESFATLQKHSPQSR